jgi:nicotinamide-nucleotide adenylyltransferase
MIGLYWGRFNPPHKGHMNLIKNLLKETDKLIIAVGSAKKSNTKRNPFSGTERVKLMKRYLKEEKIKNVKVIPVPDGKSMSAGIKNLINECPKFDVLYTDKETIIKLIKTKTKRIHRVGKISSTQIRDAIAHDKEWEHLTGKSVVKIIKKLKGIERIKKAYSKKL